MARPFALREVEAFEYVLEDNREDPPDEQTRFQLIGLTGRQRAEVRSALLRSTAAGTTIDLAQAYEAAELAVAYGLKGWAGMQRPDGTEVPWPGSGRKALERLREAHIQELATEIMKASELSEDEAGN